MTPLPEPPKPLSPRMRPGRLAYRAGSRAARMAAVASLVVVLSACQGSDPAGQPRPQRVAIGGRTFTLEVAADEASRIQGLSDRADIPRDGGMLFVFSDAAVHEFVMRRCPNPIDILFLDPSGRVVQTHEMQPEPADTPEWKLTRYSSRWPAQFAIELRGGTLREIAVKKGEKIELALADLKRLAR